MAGASHAQFTTPAAGEYIYEGSGGWLTVRPGGRFSIETATLTGHSCALDGTIEQGKARLKDPSCVVTFTPGWTGPRRTGSAMTSRSHNCARATTRAA